MYVNKNPENPETNSDFAADIFLSTIIAKEKGVGFSRTFPV